MAFGKDDDKDDPIAQAQKLREKVGGPTYVVSQTDAKKLGIKLNGDKEVKDKETPKTGRITSSKAPKVKEEGKEEKKVPNKEN